MSLLVRDPLTHLIGHGEWFVNIDQYTLDHYFVLINVNRTGPPPHSPQLVCARVSPGIVQKMPLAMCCVNSWDAPVPSERCRWTHAWESSASRDRVQDVAWVRIASVPSGGAVAVPPLARLAQGKVMHLPSGRRVCPSGEG